MPVHLMSEASPEPEAHNFKLVTSVVHGRVLTEEPEAFDVGTTNIVGQFERVQCTTR